MDMEKFRKRQIAHKLAIGQIIKSKYVNTNDLNPNYIEINGQEISRVNIIGIVVQKSEIMNYKNLIIDDGTGRLSARLFESNISLDEIDIGDFVLVIGRLREFTSEKYILIETIKKVDSGWAKVRRLELSKNLINNYEHSEEQLESKIVLNENSKNKIIKYIKNFDKGDGVSVDDISILDGVERDKVVDKLLKEGNIFEIRPGKLKILE